jgi:hypothetical protein
VFAQTNPGFIDGAVLCANAGQPACSGSPANPLSLNQAFMNKLDVTNGRTKLTAALSLYADFVSGNDANSCSMAAPCKTVQQVYNNIVANYDLAGQTVTINVVNNDTTCLSVTSAWVGGGSVVILGPGGNTTQPTIGLVCATNRAALLINTTLTGTLSISNLVLSSPSGTQATVNHFGIGIVYFNNVVFSGSAGLHVNAVGTGAKIACLGGVTVTVTQGVNVWIAMQSGAEFACTGARFVFIGTQNYSQSVVYAAQAASIFIPSAQFCANYTGTCTAVTTVTGSRYTASMNGVIETATSGNSTFIPGNMPGVLSLGGQYD